MVTCCFATCCFRASWPITRPPFAINLNSIWTIRDLTLLLARSTLLPNAVTMTGHHLLLSPAQCKVTCSKSKPSKNFMWRFMGALASRAVISKSYCVIDVFPVKLETSCGSSVGFSVENVTCILLFLETNVFCTKWWCWWMVIEFRIVISSQEILVCTFYSVNIVNSDKDRGEASLMCHMLSI